MTTVAMVAIVVGVVVGPLVFVLREVQAAWRVGNLHGQGGMNIIGLPE